MFSRVVLCLTLLLSATVAVYGQPTTAAPTAPVDVTAPRAGGAIGGLTGNQTTFFKDGLDTFKEVDAVPDGLGPRFNLNSCAGCHAFPAVGGSSPASNPQVTGNVAPVGQVNRLVNLGLISANGPVREIRYKSDGGVHDLFTIVGLPGTPSTCNISQPDFNNHLSEIIFRTPTPVFGAGLIEAITDTTILNNVRSNKPFGIRGHENRNGTDGTLTRFGWKAQNKSLVIFSGEAYNVEQGVSNELFPDERGEGGVQDSGCTAKTSPNDQTNFDSASAVDTPSDAIRFANFMRFLAPPATSCTVGANCSGSVNNGSRLFDSIGCSVCHIRTLPTGDHPVDALSRKNANLFSDLLVHNMGELGDGVGQGNAGPDEFRTAPLWGLGQRVFFLHDGRTQSLGTAIIMHAFAQRGSLTQFDFSPFPHSEAEQVVVNFLNLSSSQQQDLVNFLRTL
jgi:CxxC motif-containing protein (DUF1111 family)